MNTYDLTTWVGTEIVETEQMRAISMDEARSFARGVVTERIRTNPQAFAFLRSRYCLAEHIHGQPPAFSETAEIGEWYLAGEGPEPRVGWRRADALEGGNVRLDREVEGNGA
jgi:hypothetical protein